jgi:hypothetical protein
MDNLRMDVDKKLFSAPGLWCLGLYLFGEIWRIVPIFMITLCRKWGIGVSDVGSLGWF